MNQIRDIVTLEQLAHSIQNALPSQQRGRFRNRLVARLAQVDQLIAERKDCAGTLGKDICTYLDE